MRFGSVRLCSLFSVIIAVLMLLSVSVHPALAASLVNEQIETSVADLEKLAELTDLNDLSDLAIIQDNQISSVTLDEIDLDTTKDLSTAPTSSVANTFLAPSSAATDGDDEMMYIDRGLVHIHARDPLSDQSSDSSSLQSQLAGISVLPQESPVLAVPSDDVELSRIVLNLTDDGYIFTGMSAHQYQSTVTSEKFRSLNRDQLAVAGIHVSDTSSSTITAKEDVTYYTFTNPTTESARVVTAAQLIGADGVSLIGDRKVVVSPIVEKSAMDSQRGDNTEDFASWILDFAMMCPGVAVIPLPAEIGIAAIVGIILLIIYFCTRDSPPSPAPQTTIVQFGNPSAFTHQPSYNDYTRIGGDSAIRRTGELETYRGTGPTGKDWIQATRHAAITRDGNLVTWSDRQQEPTTVVAPGKKYVAVSQYSDWLLAIYEDTTGLTHVEPLANPMAPPSEIRNAVPTETGWKKISAGPTHALALRADDTLVAWGQNDYGQLNLPSDLHYTDIAAGSRFSIGLTTETRGWPSREGGTILAAGNDDNHQVSDAPKETDYYLKIAAGNNTAATLTRDGHIKLWGQPLDGAAPPTDGGCTDIAIGSDSGFALQEIAPEKQIDEPVGLSSSGDALIPYGSTIERSDNTVTRVIDPKGSVAFWVNDKSATHIRFPAGAVVPVTRVHYVPSHSIVDGRQSYTATVVSPPPSEEGAMSNPTGDSPSLTVTETAWYDDLNPDNPQTLPRAMCFADTGCSVGVTTKQHLFLSDNPIHPSTDDIPSLSVHQLSNTSWIGTISANNQDRSIVMEKNHASPDQPLYFSIISSNGGYEPGQNMVLSAKAAIDGGDAALHYTITSTASRSVPTMSITPKIWQQADTGDVLVFTGTPTDCYGSATCVAAGNFTPAATAMYFANATVLYSVLTTLPSGISAMQQYSIAPGSGRVVSTTPYKAMIFGVDFFEGGCVKDCNNAGSACDTLKGTAMSSTFAIALTGDRSWSTSPEETKNRDQCAYEADWKKGYSSRPKHVENYNLAAFFGHGGVQETGDGNLKHGYCVFCNADKTIPVSDRVDHLTPFNASFGSENKLKYVIFGSCQTLKKKSGDVEIWKNWQSSFNGLHMLFGFDTEMGDSPPFAQLVADDMTGRGGNAQKTMIGSWKDACQKKQAPDKTASVIYDTGCEGEYLPPYGNPISPTGIIEYMPIPCGRSLDSIIGIVNETPYENNTYPRIDGRYILTTPLPKVPEKIMIYSIMNPAVTKERVGLIAKNLGLDANEIDETERYYRINSGGSRFEVDKSNGNIDYNTKKQYEEIGMDHIPSDIEATVKAKHFLVNAQLMPPSSEIEREGIYHAEGRQVSLQGETSTVTHYITVFFNRHMDTIPIFSTHISVDIGADGEIVGLFTNWRNYTPYKEYPLINPENAYEGLKKVQLHTHIQNPDNVTVTHATLEYYGQLAGDDDVYFLQPVYRFKGYVQKGERTSNFTQIDYATVEHFYPEIIN